MNIGDRVLHDGKEAIITCVFTDKYEISINDSYLTVFKDEVNEFTQPEMKDIGGSLNNKKESPLFEGLSMGEPQLVEPVLAENDNNDNSGARKEYVANGEVKPKFSLIPTAALYEVAQAFTDGAVKYGEFNYSKGVRNIDYTDAALRHIYKYLMNEEKNDTGLSHLTHAICSLMIALDADKTETSEDARNKLYDFNKLIKENSEV